MDRRALLALAVAGLSCAGSESKLVRLERALNPARLYLLESGAASGDELALQGKVLRHAALSSEGLSIYELAVAGGSGEPVSLRYLLPGGRRLPVSQGDQVRLEVHRSDEGTLGLVIRDADGDLLAVIDEGAAVPEAALSAKLRVEPGRDVVYRESGRFRGFCEAVVEHRTARVIVVPTGERTSVIPGQTVEVSLPEGLFHVTLVDHARVERATCEGLGLDRFSWLVLRAEE